MSGFFGGPGGGAIINTTDGVIPYRSSSTAFSDSPLSVSGGNVTSTGNVSLPIAGLLKFGSNFFKYTDTVGPAFADINTGNTLTIDVQSMGSSRTLVAPAAAGTLVLAAATQTLTNKKLGSLTTNGPVYTSGGDGSLNSELRLSAARGGTGIDTSGSTGVPYVSAGTWAAETGFKFDGTNLSVGLGSTAAPTAFTVGDTSTSSPRGIMSWQASADASSAHLHMRKTRGTFASPGAVLTADVLGRVVFSGFEGSSYLETAYIRALATGTVAATRIPSKLEFWTSTDAAPSVATLALTLDKDQSATFAGKC
jgi:hypothetical protein